jgi:hypothetical protein
MIPTWMLVCIAWAIDIIGVLGMVSLIMWAIWALCERIIRRTRMVVAFVQFFWRGEHHRAELDPEPVQRMRRAEEAR